MSWRLQGMGEILQRMAAVADARPPWFRRALIIASVAALASVAAFCVWHWRLTQEPSCEESALLSDGVAVLACRREYERTGVPSTGAKLADALRRTKALDAAESLAQDLLGTDARADALQVLGKIADARNRSEEAIKYLQDARQLHRARGDHVGLARDDQVLGRLYDARQRYVEALVILDECISEARAGNDVRVEGYCHLTAARVLMSAGYFDAASQELDRAGPQLSAERDLAQLWYQRGNLEQEAIRDPMQGSHNERAAVAFERSLMLAKHAQYTSLLLNIYMNLAYSLAEIGRTDEADRYLDEAGLLDRDKKYESQRMQLAARIAYHRNNLLLAYSLNERAYRSSDDLDEQLEICVMQTRIDLARGNLAVAERWARRGVESVEKIRASQVVSELRPWVLATRREPYELLFVTLVRAARTEDAVVVFDQWQGRTLLEQMTRPGPELSTGLASTAMNIQSLARWLPAVSQASLISANDGAVAIKTLASIDLFVLAVAENTLWRITATHGRIRIDALGAMSNLRDLVDRFTATPTDVALASAAGALILPDGVVRSTDDPLYVVLDAQLSGLPIAALRTNGRALIALRPVVRAPRMPTGGCQANLEPTRALVLADAAGDLPDARGEASHIASMFGTSPLVGAAATSTALFAAKSDPLLHVAVHADADSGGGTLRLHDRSVSALEISANRLGPTLVVLSGCSTARSGDPEVAGALSTSFVAAGSRWVVATLRPISDAGALDVTSRFYASRGAGDPVRVLAAVQASLVDSNNVDWPHFAIFGNGACPQS